MVPTLQLNGLRINVVSIMYQKKEWTLRLDWITCLSILRRVKTRLVVVVINISLNVSQSVPFSHLLCEPDHHRHRHGK